MVPRELFNTFPFKINTVLASFDGVNKCAVLVTTCWTAVFCKCPTGCKKCCRHENHPSWFCPLCTVTSWGVGTRSFHQSLLDKHPAMCFQECAPETHFRWFHQNSKARRSCYGNGQESAVFLDNSCGAMQWAGNCRAGVTITQRGGMRCETLSRERSTSPLFLLNSLCAAQSQSPLHIPQRTTSKQRRIWCKVRASWQCHRRPGGEVGTAHSPTQCTRFRL